MANEIYITRESHPSRRRGDIIREHQQAYPSQQFHWNRHWLKLCGKEFYEVIEHLVSCDSHVLYTLVNSRRKAGWNAAWIRLYPGNMAKVLPKSSARGLFKKRCHGERKRSNYSDDIKIIFSWKLKQGISWKKQSKEKVLDFLDETIYSKFNCSKVALVFHKVFSNKTGIFSLQVQLE